MGLLDRSGGGRPRRAAFTLAEILIVLMIMGMLGGTWAAVGAWGRQTAAREADRAMRWLYGVLLRADNRGRSFYLSVTSSYLMVTWLAPHATERLEASEGCSFERRAGPDWRGGAYDTETVYSAQWGTFTPSMTVRVTDAHSGVHYLILSGQGRARTSDEPP